MIQLLMGAATSSNTNLLEGGVIVMGVAMLLREILPPIVKIAKKDESKEIPIQTNGYLKKIEFDKLAEKVQYKDTCIEIVKRFDSYNNEQKERMEEQKNQITALSDKVENGFNALQKTIKNGNG